MTLHWVTIGLLAVPGLALVAIGLHSLTHHTMGGGAQLIFGLILLGLVELYRRHRLRHMRAVAIKIKGGKLSFDDPLVLRRPVEIDLKDIRVAATDAGMGWEVGFPVYGYPDGPLSDKVRDYLVGPGRLTPLRFLNPRLMRSNVILLLERPIATPRPHCVHEHGPRCSEALGGIAMRVDDPAGACDLFAAHGLRSQIREDDVELLGRINSGEIQPEKKEPSWLKAQTHFGTWRPQGRASRPTGPARSTAPSSASS